MVTTTKALKEIIRVYVLWIYGRRVLQVKGTDITKVLMGDVVYIFGKGKNGKNNNTNGIE